jgi:hypothetical protein
MLSGYSAAQEIKHFWKFNGGFIEPQILNLERTTIRRDMYYEYVIQS